MYLILDENERKKTRVRNEKKFTKKKKYQQFILHFSEELWKKCIIGVSFSFFLLFCLFT